jgi:hypothetical protein
VTDARRVRAYRIECVAVDDRGALTPAVLTVSATGELIAARDADGLPGAGPIHTAPPPPKCYRCGCLTSTADEDDRELCTACDDYLERMRDHGRH